MGIDRIIDNLLQEFELGKMSRRRLIQSLAFAAGGTSLAHAVPKVSHLGFSPVMAPDLKQIKAISINHISIEAPDHVKEAAFYSDLLGLPVVDDKPGISQIIKVGETTLIFQDLGVRKEAQGVQHGTNQPGVDHISYTIADWDNDKDIEKQMVDELKARGLPIAMGQRPGKSTHFTVKDPVGLGLEVGGKNQL